MAKILLIEDDDSIRELVCFNLLEEGYDVESSGDGSGGLSLALSGDFDLILLDVMLPGVDGFEILKAVRSGGLITPVIMLTAKRGEVDKVLGLEFGADDYITKPFSVHELKARIKAVLRRFENSSGLVSGGSASPLAGGVKNEQRFPAFAGMTIRDGGMTIRDEDVIAVGEILIYVPGKAVSLSGKPVIVTNKEFELLLAFARNRGIVLSREQLLERVWGYDYAGESRTVDVHVRNLRRKLGEGCIVTLVNMGYKMP
jgi:two-component system alkaline phosphatase synthesis response regulator PhoP